MRGTNLIRTLPALPVACMIGAAATAASQQAEIDRLPPSTGQSRSTPVASTSATEKSEVPEVPGLSGLLRGVNGGITYSGVHDSASGWATIFQPAISYSFNDIFAIDITVPIYMYRLAETHAVNPRPNAYLVPRRGQPGDVIFSLHAQFIPRHFNYQATLSGTAPTGDATYGLSSGRSTFDLNNHFDHNFRYFSPAIEVGIGNSTTLVSPLVKKDYTSLGPLAHFQAGVALPLFWGLSFESNVFEQLPVGDQKIYTTTTRKGKTTTVVSGRNVAEDNGFNNSLDIPVDAHTTISAYYSRSLRLRYDVVSLGLTYVFRTYQKEDAALRAAQENLRLRKQEAIEHQAQEDAARNMLLDSAPPAALPPAGLPTGTTPR